MSARPLVRTSARSAASPPLLVHGMHGLGDNLHQRAIVRQLMQRRRVILETPWPCVYHDLVGDRLTLISKGSRLPAQAKNAQREAAAFSRVAPPANAEQIKVNYPPAAVRTTGSVLGAMAQQCGVDSRSLDFRLPVPLAWRQRAQRWLARWQPTKPMLIYRPLAERSWWSGCTTRNPDHAAYAALFRAIAHRYFVVSIADFEPGIEWLVGEQVQADVTLHAGELDFETLAALTAQAGLVFTSPGFAVILAQAVGTPVVTVFGGYEDATSFAAGAHYAACLPIEPVTPCNCFSHTHACDKRIDIAQALDTLQAFVHETADRQPRAA